jgi:3-methyladenine DNA glycosylase AlkC
MAVGLVPDVELAERLRMARAFASDPNFTVREWAWIAVRPHISENLELAISSLTEWANDPDPLVRRFASEATRPRGVWCRHIPQLKAEPNLAYAILQPMKDDPERYVQLSVGNWLNDAGKTRPDWTIQVCDQWMESPSHATRAICRRGLRSMKSEQLRHSLVRNSPYVL